MDINTHTHTEELFYPDKGLYTKKSPTLVKLKAHINYYKHHGGIINTNPSTRRSSD